MGPVVYHPVFHLLDLFPFVCNLGLDGLNLGPDVSAQISVQVQQDRFIQFENGGIGFQRGNISREEFICDLCADEQMFGICTAKIVGVTSSVSAGTAIIKNTLII